MLIATFGPSTSWVGKRIVYEGQRFVLEGFGEITAQGVLEYDRQAHLDWAYDGLREWVREMAAALPNVSGGTAEATGTPLLVSTGAQLPYRPRAASDGRRLRNILVIGGIGLVLVLAIIIIAAVNSSSSGPSDAAAYVGNVHTTLGQTTFREVLYQMPPDIRGFFDVEVNANMDRVYTWTFKDGSKMIFAFQPKGGEGAMQGLVLSWTDVKD